jgi:succinyl-diaminopimelate desuccinylase
VQQKIEATLAKLVSIPSISADSRACHDVLAFVQSELQDLGLFIYTVPDASSPWLVATTWDTKTPDILLASHLDVVPAPDKMFTIERRGDALYGRGVYDMKFAASCYIELFKAHIDQLRHRNIGILFTTDEEINSSSMAQIMAWGLRPAVVLLPDGGDGWTIESRAKGTYGVELIAHGKTAHGSRPWEGDNALHRILDVVQTLRGHYPSIDPAMPTLSATVLRSGDAVNQIPHFASVKIDFRCFDKHDLIDYRHLVADLARQYNLDLRLENHGDPVFFDPNHPWVQNFQKTLAEQTGQDIVYRDSYGATDARYFAQYDVPCIIIEPNGGGRHSDDEWIKASDLERFYQLIRQWVLDATALEPLISPSSDQSLSVVR